MFGVSYADDSDYVSDSNIKAELVWSEFDGENNEIYYSRLEDNIWTQKVQISNNGFRNISPSISSGTDGITRVVWTAISGSKSHLLFSNYDGKTWSSPTQISTNLSSNTAPSIVVDNEDIPWIIWAGFDGQDDDIFFTRWNGYDWDAPQRVNKDDSLPDILPIIGIDEDGIPWVEWSGYDGEKYRNYSSTYTGSEWNEEIEAETIKESVSNDDLDMDSVQVFRQDSNDKLYLAFGDSITRGVVRSDGTTAEGYEPELEALIDANLWASQVYNSGKSGERTSGGVNRLVKILNTYSLDYVLFLEGTNDILDGVSYETTLYNLGIMVDYCIDYNVTPIIATLLPIKKSSNKGGYVDEIPNVYNPGIKEIASGREITVSDQYAAFDGQWNRYSDDGVHPNEAGYSVMAQTWYDTVTSFKPTVTAVSANVIGESNATLNGVVNPNGFNTTCYFEYGVNESYETGSVNKNASTPAIDVGSGIGNVTVNAEVTGLTPETTYHFRLVATNNSGTTFGNDQTFTTLSEPEEEEDPYWQYGGIHLTQVTPTYSIMGHGRLPPYPCGT